MARFEQKALTTNEAFQTVGLGALGLTCGIGLVVFGGIYIFLGILAALLCSAVIALLHRDEFGFALRERRFQRVLALPIAMIIGVVAMTIIVAARPIVLRAEQGPIPIEVYVSENARLKASVIPMPSDREEAKREMEDYAAQIDRTSLPTIVVDKDFSCENIIVRNMGREPVKDAEIIITSNKNITPETRQASSSYPNQVSDDRSVLEPYDPFGSSLFVTLAFPVVNNEPVCFITTVQAVSYKPVASIACLNIRQDESSLGYKAVGGAFTCRKPE